MLQLIPHHRLLLAVNPVDFRRGIDGLAAACQLVLNEQPLSGTVFVFANRSRTAVKILVYVGHGYWLCHRRFSKGKLKWWPSSVKKTAAINAADLQVLLYQGLPHVSQMSAPFKSVRTKDD